MESAGDLVMVLGTVLAMDERGIFLRRAYLQGYLRRIGYRNPAMILAIVPAMVAAMDGIMKDDMLDSAKDLVMGF